MASDAGKLRVLIPTTRGPVEVLLLTEEDPAIGRSVACIGGTTETADIASAYHAFVVRPTGLIESRFGHSCYRLDVSGRIDAGSSWQLAVLAAHALYAAGRLAGEKDTAAGVLWATGSVRPVDLTVGAVNHVREKLESSVDRLKQEAAAGRRVLLALPAPNADEVSPTLATELSEHGIEVVALQHVEPLFRGLAMALPDAPQKRAASKVAARMPAAGHRRGYVWGGLAAAILCIVVGVGLFFGRQPAPAVEPKPASVPGPPAENSQPAERALVPELVPFVSERDKIVIRDIFMPAQPYKSLAVGLEYMGFVSGQPSQKIADEAAVEACTKRTNTSRAAAGYPPVRVCEVYASGDVVVTKRGQPPMPPAPWLIRDPSVERPFVAADLPVVSPATRDEAAKNYLSRPKSKAYVIGPARGGAYFSHQPHPEEAMRRALERCGYEVGVPCMVIAVDDSFVVPIPVTAKVIGFYRPTALTAVPPTLRDDIARRLANATSGWNAVAVGAGGRVGLKVGAPSERAAVEASMEACRTQDRDCRVAVLGPFLVEALPERAAVP
jgi:hypothetical protein